MRVAFTRDPPRANVFERMTTRQAVHARNCTRRKCKQEGAPSVKSSLDPGGSQRTNSQNQLAGRAPTARLLGRAQLGDLTSSHLPRASCPEVSECQRCRRCRGGVEAVSIDTGVNGVEACRPCRLSVTGAARGARGAPAWVGVRVVERSGTRVRDQRRHQSIGEYV